jgi:AcrR family transcriptional regulator
MPSAMAPAAKTLTAKGERGAARILDAATVVLARHGLGGATLARIAEEAGTDKRSVLYYYGSREALLVRVVQAVGEQIATYIGSATGTAESPRERAEAAVDAMWTGVTSAPEHARAYFAMLGGGAGAPVVEDALRVTKAAFAHGIRRHLRPIDGAAPASPDDDLAGATMFAVAILRGLLLEWFESGDTPALRAGLERFKGTIAAELERMADGAPVSG